MNLIHKRVAVDDAKVLTGTGIEVLRAVNQLSEDVDMSEVKRQSYDYYKKGLVGRTHTVYLVCDGDIAAGTGGISYYGAMSTCHNVSGSKAYIMNMYASPNYRREGTAYKALKLLIDDVRKKGITHISLEVTDMERPLYEKFRSVKMNDEMELPND